MKRNLLLLLGGALLFSSCYDAGSGAVHGGQFGYVIGSAIGGITGGGRGHDWGALIGTVSGVAAGAAIGAATEKAREEKYMERAKERERRYDNQQRDNGYDNQQHNSGYNNREWSKYDESDFDPNGGGDDRVDFGIGNGPVSKPDESPLEIRNAFITETKRDGVLTRGEECSVMFEIYNTTSKPIYDIRPLVCDMTGNKHIKISPNLRVESIAPHQGIRYTATIRAGKKLKDGEIKVMVGVSHRQRVVSSQTRYFTVPTAKGFEN